jgi:hypothetical protein
VRVAVGERADAAVVAGVVRAALAQGAPGVELVFRDSRGLPTAVRVGPRWHYAQPGAHVDLFLVLHGERVELRSSAGERVAIQDAGGALDTNRLRQVLASRRQREPHRRDLILVPTHGADGARLALAAATAADHFPDLALGR